MERWGHKQPPAPVHSPRHQGPRGAPAPSPEAPTERKRLVLAPRSSKPVDEGAVSEEAVGESASEKPRKVCRCRSKHIKGKSLCDPFGE